MDYNKKNVEPDNTAVRTALWRALHIQVDAKPHILEDDVGLKLIVPGFKEAKTISTKDMVQYYFRNRTDNLLPASGEVFLLAIT